MTEKIIIAPIVKVKGNKQYVVESFFENNSNMDLTDKVKKLIEKMLVYEPIHVNGKKCIQKIQIYYNFIGRIQLPMETKRAGSE